MPKSTPHGSSNPGLPSLSHRTFISPGYNWLEMSWPTIGFCVVIIGVILATQTGRNMLGSMADALHHIVVPSDSAAVRETDRVLIVTANPNRQLEISATLSPRGLDPLLARDLAGAGSQLAAHSQAVRLAVVDGALPDAGAVVRRLKSALPADRIVVLLASCRHEDVGQLLLDRL